MRHHYQTKGTCSTKISFDLDGDIVRNVAFENGCPGNLQALSKLVDGLTAAEIDQKLSGIHCGSRSTSCADQLCRGIRKACEVRAARKGG